MQPGTGINVIWGANGQGKTNLLEGIYLFSYFKSFRGAGNGDLVGPAAGVGRVGLEVCSARVAHRLELNVTPRGREFLLDGKTPRPLVRMLDGLRTVLFTPDELHLLRTVPAARRALLDRAVFQLDPGYLGRALHYDRVLRQRNRLLREGARAGEIAPWSEALVKAGAPLRQGRRDFLRQFLPLLDETHRKLSGADEAVAIAYPGGEDGTEEERMRREVMREAGRELRMRQTCAGPHRDDPVFLLAGLPVRQYASQGEWRTIVLSFKIALLRLLHRRLGTAPVFLLDDMAAELDGARQQQLFGLLADMGTQIFLTTTDPALLRRLGRDEIRFFHMEEGRLSGSSPH